MLERSVLLYRVLDPDAIILRMVCEHGGLTPIVNGIFL